jgi:hypothetical protein
METTIFIEQLAIAAAAVISAMAALITDINHVTGGKKTTFEIGF